MSSTGLTASLMTLEKATDSDNFFRPETILFYKVSPKNIVSWYYSFRWA